MEWTSYVAIRSHNVGILKQQLSHVKFCINSDKACKLITDSTEYVASTTITNTNY